MKEKLKGYLVVSSYQDDNKFKTIYQTLIDAFRNEGIVLESKNAMDLGLEIDSKKPDVDFILFWDKDNYLAKKLENMGLRLFNNAQAIEECDNKALTYLRLSKEHIPTPKPYLPPKTFIGVSYPHLRFLDGLSNYPYVIKEAYGSYGNQVYLVNNRKEAEELIKSFGYKDFIIQEYIKEAKGRDIRVNVVGNRVINAIERTNDKDFRSNLSNGGHGEEYKPSKAIQELALKACKALNLDFAGVDILVSNKGPLICEINSNPHFLSTLEITGHNLAIDIAKYIKEQLCQDCLSMIKKVTIVIFGL